MIALVADVHVGNHRTLGGQTVARLNDRCRETIQVLAAACRRAKLAGADTLAVLGDLFDTDDPSPPMVREVLEALKLGPSRVYLLVGNHDQRSDKSRDHALASMDGVWGSLYISVVEKPSLALTSAGLSMAMVPFRSGRASEWLPDAISVIAPSKDPPLLCFHLGISDSQVERDEPWMMGSHDQIHVDELCDILCRTRQFSGVAAGNWHQYMEWEGDCGEPIIQLGALCPTGWNNQGGDDLYGTLALWDGESFTREVIAGPRYLKFTKYDDWAEHAGNEQIRSRIVVPVSRLGITREKVSRNEPMGHVEVLADAKTTHKRARSAAVASRAAADSDSALAEFCSRMEKPEGVSSGEILEATRGYLGGISR